LPLFWFGCKLFVEVLRGKGLLVDWVRGLSLLGIRRVQVDDMRGTNKVLLAVHSV
jgi:hypothetical protein